MNIKIPAIQKSIFSTRLTVRIQDINYGQHLGHDSLVSYLHECRVEWLRSLGYTELEIDGAGILITELAVNYMNQAYHADEMIIHIEVGQIKKASMQLIYQVRLLSKDIEIARAYTNMAFYDGKSRKIARIPDPFLESLQHKGRL